MRRRSDGGEQDEHGDTGSMGFRVEGEPVDDRRLLHWSQFWANEGERLTYEGAVAKHPKGEDEGPMAYAARISAIVTGAYAEAGLEMPRVRLSQRKWAEKQWELRKSGMVHYEE